MGNPYYKQHWIEIEPERHQAYEQILSFHPAMEPLLAPLEMKAGLRVLDVGSGPGHTTIELARRAGAGGRVTGIDINRGFVERASKRTRENNLKVDFRCAAFPPLPFADASFDRVWCKNVLEYVDSATATMTEMARVAAAGGIVAASDSDWEMIALELKTPAQARSDRIVAAAKAIALNEPRIGRRLFGLFRATGLRDVKVTIMAGADTSGRSLPMLKASLARYATDSKKVDAGEIEQWFADIDAAIRDGDFLFVLPQFVARGVKGQERRSTVPGRAEMIPAWLAFFDGMLSVALVAAGMIAAHFYLTKPFIGFQFFAVGFVLGIIGLLLGLIGLFVTRGAERAAARPRAIVGTVLCAIVVVPILAKVLSSVKYPPINDITTDFDNPPEFIKASTLVANAGRDMKYDKGKYSDKQQAGYGALAPLAMSAEVDATFAKVQATAAQMPTWTITATDPATHTIEGVDTSWLFHFQDDFIIQVRPAEAGKCLVEMRSKSRDGVGDFGVNFTRIETFLGKLQQS